MVCFIEKGKDFERSDLFYKTLFCDKIDIYCVRF